MTASFRIVGHRVPRLDARSKVTGSAIYGADLHVQGMLHGVLVRSTVAHARIVRIDCDQARALPGVRAVVTAADVPGRYGSFIKDMEVFASSKVLYVGQPIAAVAARTREQAEAAARAVSVAYETFPILRDVDDALADGACLLHDNWQDYRAMPTLERAGNVSNRARLILGNAGDAFARCDAVFAHRFATNLVHPGYTEPRASLATWDDDGVLTIQSNTQLPFETQATLAEIFGLAPSQVRVSVSIIGGGFGGKLRLGTEHYAAALARKAGAPVKVVTTCEEELIAAHPRQPLKIWLKTGVTRDGEILAKQARVFVDTGATSGSGVGVASSVMLMLAGPYRSPNLHFESVSVYTNKTPTGSFRAPSGPQGNFAVESQMDIIADAIGMDPLAFRLKNIVRDGDLAPNGQRLSSVSLEQCLTKVADEIGWDRRRPEKNRGKGLACGWWTTTSGSSGVFVKIAADGHVFLNTGCAEIGTAAVTGAVQILAEALHVDLSTVRVTSGDTATTPFDYGAQGSRTTFAVGNACLDAARKIIEKGKAIAAKKFSVAAEDVVWRDGMFAARADSLSLAQIAAMAQLSEGGLIAEGTFIAPPTLYDKDRAKNMVITTLNSPSFHAHAADVSVDPETGVVRIIDYVVAQDVGFAINPTYIEGQIEGGVAQGIGQTLSEEIVYRDGVVLNPGLTDYKMPTALDVPRIRSFLIESPSEVGPFGAKGVGEPPVIEPPAALANAIASASGRRVFDLPIVAEDLVRFDRGIECS